MEAIGVLSPYKPLQWNVLGCREASAVSRHLPNNLEKPFQRTHSTGDSCPVRAFREPPVLLLRAGSTIPFMLA